MVIPKEKIPGISIESVNKRLHIRRVLSLSVSPGSSSEKIEKALENVRIILNDHEGMSNDFPPRVHFTEFNDDSLNIQILYWYSPAGI